MLPGMVSMLSDHWQCALAWPGVVPILPDRWPAVDETELTEISNTPSPCLQTQNSWTPDVEGKTKAPTEQFEKY